MATSPLGQRLKALREDRGLSQAQLAMRSGIPQGNISFIEAGKRLNIGMENLTALARGLHCSLDELVGFDKDATPQTAVVDSPRIGALEKEVRGLQKGLDRTNSRIEEGFAEVLGRLEDQASRASKQPRKQPRRRPS